MDNEIFVTSWRERQRFEEQLLKLANQQVKDFKGIRLMSWYSNKKEPIIDEEFMSSLPGPLKGQIQDLIKSLQ